MEIDRPALTVPALATPKRIWVSPAVSDLGSMRELTLLQGGGSGGGICDPFEDPNCP
jgi:hypothetical protein